MRIVGGKWRGRPLNAPEGRNTRPTTDRMRESLASMILSAYDLDLSDCSVLDAFAGSGAVGLELLSRGAAHCTFCEGDRRTAGIVRQNCKALGADQKTWSVVAGDAFRLPKRGHMDGAPFSLVFLDPPYAMPADDVSRLVAELDAAGMLAQACNVVYERASGSNPLDVQGFCRVRGKDRGGTSIDLLSRGGTQ